MKMTLIVTYRRGKKSKQMQFARVVEMDVVPERGDFITATRVDADRVLLQSSVLARACAEPGGDIDQREQPQRFRVQERELFSQPQPVVFGDAVIYAKPGNRAAQAIESYVSDNSGESEDDVRTPEEAASHWFRDHGFVPLPCLRDMAQDRKWRSKVPNARDHFEIARAYLGDTVKTV